jgi:hypothetical protein
MIVFDAYTAPLQEGVEKSASTDRGWGYLEGADHPCGNYLDYRPIGPHCNREDPSKLVHAVAYLIETDSNTGMQYTRRLGFKWCTTVGEAQRWIEETVTGQQSLALD